MESEGFTSRLNQKKFNPAEKSASTILRLWVILKKRGGDSKGRNIDFPQRTLHIKCPAIFSIFWPPVLDINWKDFSPFTL